jgi:hypothetical protein
MLAATLVCLVWPAGWYTAGEERGLICWINGAFGAGKTALAAELYRRCPDALLYDPEETGFLLRGLVPPAASGDFQDLPAWRQLVVETARVLADQYGRLVIAPMTVVSPVYLGEIFGGLAGYGIPVRHFFLDVPPGVLRQRIGAQVIHPGDPARDAEVRAWRLAQVDRCAAAAGRLPSGTVILDGELSPGQLAREVLQTLGRDTWFVVSSAVSG